MTKARRFYISVEVDFFDHPKVKRAGERLAYRHLQATAWSHKYRTDGHLPRKSALAIVYSQKSADELVAAGLWDECEDGWRIHDYLEHQRSKVELDAAAEAGRKGAAGRHGKG